MPLLLASQLCITSVASASTDPNGLAKLTAAEVAALKGSATQHVIVELRRQPTVGSDRGHQKQRAAQVAGLRSSVVGELKQVGAKNVKTYNLLPTVAATVSPAEARYLATRPDVAAVVPDTVVHLPATDASTPAAGTNSGTGTGGTTGCSSDPKNPVPDEYLSTTHTGSSASQPGTARSLGIDGSGVKVGFIADAINADNPDFIRPDGSKVVADIVDFTGAGVGAPTGGGEAFIDSSAIAATGQATHDIGSASSEPYGPRVESPHCYVQVEGVAPGASLVDLSVFGGENAYNSTIAQAIDYANSVEHVQVLNESFGGNPFPDNGATDLTRQANDDAVAAGITVVESSGDAGVNGTTGSPATDPQTIGVGASTTYQAFTAAGYGGAQFAPNGYESDNISTISSSGIDQAGRTIDVVAPGEENWSTCDADTTKFTECTNFLGKPTDVFAGGGTSQSSPITAGVAALVVEAYQRTHGGTAPTPAQVKQFITSTATDINAPADQQGAGEVNAYRAVLAAEQAPGSAVTSASQLDAQAAPGTTRVLKDTITNTSGTTETYAVSSRTLGAPTTISSGSTRLADGGPTCPAQITAACTTTDYGGGAVNVVPVTLRVPSGANRLNVDIAYTSPDPSANNLNQRVRLSLVDPRGRIASYDLPQGNGNHDYAQVTNPQGGVWTAYVWSRTTGRGGFAGPVLYRAQTETFTDFGRVSPATLTLRPGRSAPVTLTVATPSTPGDQSGSIVLTGTGGTTTVPVALRSLAATSGTAATVTGTVLGGNGRAYFTGQGAFYQLDVKHGLKALNADIELGGSPNTTFYAELVDPTGQAQSVGSNTLVGGDQSNGQQQGTQLHVLKPLAGRWLLAINFYNQVSGASIGEPYTVSVDTAAVPVTAAPSGSVAAGKSITVPVRVTNHGKSPEEYFVDARTAGSTQLQLTSLSGSTTTVPDLPSVGVFLVPSHTQAIAYGASSSKPIYAEANWDLGDPDLRTTASTQPIGIYAPVNGSPVSDGFWSVIPSLQGPFTTGQTPIPATVGMVAQTAPFDPAVTSPTGDLWASATDPNAPFAPIVAQPGQTVTIPVTITPTGGKGSTVRGTLYVAQADLGPLSGAFGAQPFSSDVAALPYKVTVK